MPARIRLATPADAPALVDIFGPSVLETANSFELDVPTVPEAAQRITDTLRTLPWLVAQLEGHVAGFAYASHRYPPLPRFEAYQWAVELSVYVSPHYQHRHVAKGLYIALLEALRILGYHRAYAGIAQPNTASVCFHKAMGFRLVGIYTAIVYKMGKWHDEAWYEYLLRDHHVTDYPGGQPPAPEPLPALQQDEEFVTALQKGAQYIK